MGILIQVSTGGDITFEIHTQRRTLGASAGKTEDHPAAVIQQQPQALAAAHRAIHRIDVAEIIGSGDGSTRQALALQAR